MSGVLCRTVQYYVRLPCLIFSLDKVGYDSLSSEIEVELPYMPPSAALGHGPAPARDFIRHPLHSIYVSSPVRVAFGAYKPGVLVDQPRHRVLYVEAIRNESVQITHPTTPTHTPGHGARGGLVCLCPLLVKKQL